MSSVMLQEQTDEICIAHRFRGPTESGNGGYSCGMLAAHLDGVVEVTLKAPIPLDKMLRVVAGKADAALFDGAQEIACARQGRLSMDIPAAPTIEEATQASKRYAGFDNHLLPECFVCGPTRCAGDALCIFAGPVAGPLKDGLDMVAAPWAPDASLAGDDGLVSPEHIWAALDCPGYFGLQKPGLTALLGRMTARIDVRPRPGDLLIATGWAVRSEGRKHVAGTAIFTASGDVLACAESIWVELKETMRVH